MSDGTVSRPVQSAFSGSLFPGVRFGCLGSNVLFLAGHATDDLHLVPVIGKLFTTIKARDICACEGSGVGMPLSRPFGNRKAKPLVRAPE